MKWPQLFTRSRNAATRNSTHLDIRLIRQVRPRSFPSWRQLKYIVNFLSSTERRLLTSAFFVSLVMVVVMAVGFVTRHVVATAAEGGVYTEAMVGQPKYVNPIFSPVNDIDADLVPLIYTGLFRYNQTGALEPYAADSYTTSSDGTVYTVHIRPNITWSDGQPLTADDVLYTFELIQNPDVGSPLYATFQGVKIERATDDTIRFTLKSPFAPFLQSLTVGILPAHIWSDYSPASIRLAKSNLQPVGSGPWQFSKLTKDASGIIQTFTVVPNKNYFLAQPFIQTLRFHFFNDYPQAIEALRNQQVSAISFLPRDSEKRLSSSAVHSYGMSLPQTTALFFNQTQSPGLKDNAVRVALAQAINKSDIVASALGGAAHVLENALPPSSIGYDPNGSKIDFSPTSAIDTLDKSWGRLTPEEYFKVRRDSLLSDYQTSISSASSTDTVPFSTSTIEDQITETIRQEMNADQPYYRQDKNGTILHLTITVVDTPEYVRVANAVAAAWRKVGIITAVQVVNSHQINRTVLHDRNFQVLLYGEIVGLDPDLYPFWHSSQVAYPGLNLAQFADRAADKLLEEARSTAETTARAALYQKFQKIMTDEVPAIFLYQPTYTFAASTDVHGIAFGALNTPSDRYLTLPSWYIKTKWQWK